MKAIDWRNLFMALGVLTAIFGLPYVLTSHPIDWAIGLRLEDRELLKGLLGPTTALAVFVLAQIIAAVVAWRTAGSELRRTIIAIYSEIAENHRDSSKALAESDATVAAIKARLRRDDEEAVAGNRSPSYRPLIVVNESADFYKMAGRSVLGLHRDCLLAIRAYYRDVADQYHIKAAIDSDAFVRISLDSRCSTIDDLWGSFRKSHKNGNRALERLEQRYPKTWFEGLRSDLDDVLGGHPPSPVQQTN